MPIFEYVPDDRECLLCQGRIELLQNSSEQPYKLCPYCGLDVKKVVSAPAIIHSYKVDVEKAGKKGFTTYKKAEKGIYERIAGDGPSTIQKGAGFDSKAENNSSGKIFDLDS